MRNWQDIDQWRKAKRAEMLERRTAAGFETHAQMAAGIEAHCERVLNRFAGKTVGFYWPFFKGEFDALPVVRRFMKRGGGAALPALLGFRRPMEYRLWTPESELEPGPLRIPVVKERKPVVPDVLLVPFLGFDRACHRLGFGYGFYDRTLATLAPKPWAIGVGQEFLRLDTIYPQAHDQPMDVIVTEAGIYERT